MLFRSRGIRKVQNTCELLHKCTNVPSILNVEHSGILFDKKQKTIRTSLPGECIECFIYSVYLEDLKLISKLQSYNEFYVGEKYSFKLYLFHNEYKQKIRVQLVE